MSVISMSDDGHRGQPAAPDMGAEAARLNPRGLSAEEIGAVLEQHSLARVAEMTEAIGKPVPPNILIFCVRIAVRNGMESLLTLLAHLRRDYDSLRHNASSTEAQRAPEVVLGRGMGWEEGEETPAA